jgi:hypothetical protein
MRKKRDPETAAERDERIERHARLRSDEASAEAREIDAAIRRRIKLHGA